MVDSTGFFTLGHVFTAHVTGNMVLAAGLAVEGGTFHWAQLLAIPIFMVALGAVWLVAQASRRYDIVERFVTGLFRQRENLLRVQCRFEDMFVGIAIDFTGISYAS